jgi:hypothetical protein
MTTRFLAHSLSAAALIGIFSRGAAEDLEPDRVKEEIFQGRTIIRYEHDILAEWNYQAPQRDYLYVMLPSKPPEGGEKAPLRVILHSAGHSCEVGLRTYLGPGWPGDFHSRCGESFYGVFLDCDQHKEHDHWWGHKFIYPKGLEQYKDKLTPTEMRLFAEIEWALRTFPVDRDRVYLSGGSMGGSGSLGLGMVRGDLFAAINVLVPAYAKHALYRLSNGKHPDPPPVFDFTAQNDAWSREHEQFLAYCKTNRYALAFAWGPYDHPGPAALYNAALYEFPWLTIRRNEAYPVFIAASSDQVYPGFKNMTAPDQVGQINAYFRWKNLTDTKDRFAIELRLMTKSELSKPGDLDIPTTSTADVTLRRLQAFHVEAGTTCSWRMMVDGRARQSGEVVADAEGLLTIPRLVIETAPAQLTLERKR